MTQVTVKVEAGQVKRGLTQLGQAIPKVVNDDVRLMLESAQRELSQEGQPITYPVRWDSERQRRAFFATDGFGRGIPTKRTGAYVRAFRVEKTGFGAARAYTLFNDARHARYVGGSGTGVGQSRIHQGRWKIIAQVVEKYARNLVRVVETGIREVIQRAGFGL